MRIGVPKENLQGERRVALVPAGVEKLIKLGAEVVVEKGAGLGAAHTDQHYQQAGAVLEADRKALLSGSDVVLRVHRPPIEDVAALRSGLIHISFLDPFNQPELITALAEAGVSAVAMEMIPRTTLAQKMDALSSQANLAGYVAVVLAAEHLTKIFPMMTTPAGTIAPARVFVIGAGVAGLQAIATAKRLGARVDAYDTRPVVEEQVKSLGARFVQVDVGETGQTKDGYAKPLTEDQLRIQREAMAKVCAQSDVVITTAQVFGRQAPTLVTAEMVAGMKEGSVVVDMAVESGGNVEGSRRDEVALIGGVKIIGFANLASRAATPASQVYSSNLVSMISEFWNRDAKRIDLRLEHEILQACLVTHGGEILNQRLRNPKQG